MKTEKQKLEDSAKCITIPLKLYYTDEQLLETGPWCSEGAHELIDDVQAKLLPLFEGRDEELTAMCSWMDFGNCTVPEEHEYPRHPDEDPKDYFDRTQDSLFDEVRRKRNEKVDHLLTPDEERAALIGDNDLTYDDLIVLHQIYHNQFVAEEDDNPEYITWIGKLYAQFTPEERVLLVGGMEDA